MRTLIAAELVVFLVIVTVWLYPQSLPAAIAIARQDSVCPIGDVWDGGPLRVLLNEEATRIREGSKLLETDESGFEYWGTPEGNYWVPGGSGQPLPFLLAQQSADQYGDGVRTVQPGDIALDAGAHVGIWTREALARGASVVVAIEPAPANLECIRRNLKDEIAAGKVIVYPKGIWDVEDSLPLWEDPNNSAADNFFEKGGAVSSSHSIPLVPIDLLVKELSLDRVDVIKMDIKGAVTRALKGATVTLDRFDPNLIIATEEVDDNPFKIVALMETLAPGYRVNCSSCSIVEGLKLWPDVLLLSR